MEYGKKRTYCKGVNSGWQLDIKTNNIVLYYELEPMMLKKLLAQILLH